MKLNLKSKMIEELALDAHNKGEHLQHLLSIGRPDDPKERKRLAVDLALARNASHEAERKLANVIFN